MVIPEDAGNPVGGWEFINFYTATIEGTTASVQEIGEMHWFLPIYDEEFLQEKTLPFFGDQRVFSFFSTLIPEVPPFRLDPPLTAVRDMVGAEYYKVLSGIMTPVEFAEHVQAMAELIVRDFD